MAEPLDGISELVAVAEAGGFSAAARRMGTSKSVLSERIGRLEARLGARLLHRTTRRLGLTEAGHVYYEHGRRILAEAALAQDALQELGGEPRGTVRVTAAVQFASAHLAPALPRLRARHPHMGVDLIADDELRDLAAEGVDVAIRFARLDNPTMVARRLAPLRYLLCAAPSYLERRGVPEHPAELGGHECLLYRAAPDWAEWTFRGGDGAEPVRVRATGSVCSNSGVVMRAAAVAGGGIALLTTANAGEDLRTGRLVEVLRGWTLEGLEDRSVWAVYPGSRGIPPKVRAFVHFLAEHIGDPPYWEKGL